ncbi:MAG: nucleoside deaminase, partial [Clostridia bacterium]|nr:nucleoside deaminase [Clostridia bacterium]
CAGAIVNARIKNVYFGAWDPKAGCFGSVIDFNELPFNHKPQMTGGVLEEECGSILTEHFKRLRMSKE